MANIEYIARAVIRNSDSMLICRGLGNNNWFFPGGHIEEGESAPVALLRELEEELGVTGKVVRFLGASENIFDLKGKQVQEINLVFEVTLDSQGAVKSKEAHLEFAWVTLEELRDLNVFPVSLRDAILATTNELKPLIWTSEGFE